MNILKFVLVFMCAFLLVGCNNEKETDALRFKKEYESLNGEKRGDNTIRNVKIDKNNPMVYISEDELIDKLNCNEPGNEKNVSSCDNTFLVYFGFNDCPWCRSVIETLINTSIEEGLEKIYYVDVKNIRDTIKLDDDGNISEHIKGTDGYHTLIESFNSVLKSYEINGVDTGEKRIYAPTIIAVVDGKAEKMISGISDLQSNAYDELTSDIKDDMKKNIKEIIEMVNNSVCEIGKGC